jgi:hypothetical protein
MDGMDGLSEGEGAKTKREGDSGGALPKSEVPSAHQDD